MASKASGPVKRRETKEVVSLLESMADLVIEAAKKGKDPSFDIPVRSLNNVNYNKKKRFIEMGKSKTERHLFNMGMAKKFMQTMLTADALMELQREDATTSLREVFYRNKRTIGSENTFDKQEESDPIIEDIEVTLALLREELHVRAGDTGQLIGPLTIIESGDTIDCSRQGIGGKAVPSIVEPGYLDVKSCTADFILLIEKGTQFNRLSEDKFWKKHNCILLTGGGQPPRGVRRLARRLHDEWNLPVYVLVDNDPWGYYIYSVVKQGSINLAFESQRMAIPDAKFIGLSSRDPEAYGLPRSVGIVLEKTDVERAKQLLKYDWFQKKEWQSEIEYMLKSNLKFELDALAKKNFRYLTTDYLPRKLKEKDWLD